MEPEFGGYLNQLRQTDQPERIARDGDADESRVQSATTGSWLFIILIELVELVEIEPAGEVLAPYEASQPVLEVETGRAEVEQLVRSQKWEPVARKRSA